MLPDAVAREWTEGFPPGDDAGQRRRGGKGAADRLGDRRTPLLLGHGLLHHDGLAAGQHRALAGDEGAVLGADHRQTALGDVCALLGSLQLSLEPAHAGQVGRGHGLLRAPKGKDTTERERKTSVFSKLIGSALGSYTELMNQYIFIFLYFFV